jgi:hypothetical protein
MTTALPPDAPRAYSRALLGKNVHAWMRAKGFIDNRYVLRLEPAPKLIVDLKA